jgi:hypothetical protein
VYQSLLAIGCSVFLLLDVADGLSGSLSVFVKLLVFGVALYCAIRTLGTERWRAKKSQNRIMRTGLSRFPYRRAIILAAVCRMSWLISPVSVFPTLIFLGIVTKVCVDLIRRKNSRYVWILVLTFAFVGVGTVHDLTVDTFASALCADGTYSYSAHSRGTCSWHHGVALWSPRIPPWWERFSKAPS